MKESGCNKMVCVCGYAMCYLCREGLNTGGGGGGGEAGDGREQGGYEHFCGHFRASGNRDEACGKCGKCELFREVDEEEERRRAGEEVRRKWEGSKGERERGVRGWMEWGREMVEGGE